MPCNRPDRKAATLLSHCRYWTEWPRVRWWMPVQAELSHKSYSHNLSWWQFRVSKTCGHRYHPIASRAGDPSTCRAAPPPSRRLGCPMVAVTSRPNALKKPIRCSKDPHVASSQSNLCNPVLSLLEPQHASLPGPAAAVRGLFCYICIALGIRGMQSS